MGKVRKIRRKEGEIRVGKNRGEKTKGGRGMRVK